MKAIYILSNEYGIQKATRSLDEATLWEVQGGSLKGVLLHESTSLATEIEDDTILIKNEDWETVATFNINYALEEHQDRINGAWSRQYELVSITMLGKLLKDINITTDLKKEIESESYKLIESKNK